MGQMVTSFLLQRSQKKVIELIKAGRRELDLQKRQKIYWELEKVLYEDYTDVWVGWELDIVAYRKVVQGYNHRMMLQSREAYSKTHPTWFKDGHP